ncbi:MAG TPA: hypothetical protein VKA19_04410 [Alphaproteobacteria bacterium]|nr:hypothetical protein [Alphaproteobacteria bacterium]
MREPLVWDSRKGVSGMPKSKYLAKYGEERAPCFMVVRDIEPYRSVVTGEHITGRRQHREHLKAHGLQEVGNETIKPTASKPLPPIQEDIKQSIAEVQSGNRPARAETFNPEEFE